jgi:MYXO-CTERM domain-containing protein
MLVSALSLVLLGPVGPTDPDTDVHECMHPDDPQVWSDVPDEPVSIAYDCTESKDTGYVKGDPFEITVVTVDGDPVEVETANAFIMLAEAAAADGVTLKINSGFRTMAEQEYFYGCYINCNCNNCNEAAKPGFSNHQSGHALDINTSANGVYNWLQAHGGDYGWTRTVPSEDWHWEWWGDGPPTSGPCGVVDYAAKYSAQSFPLASAPPIVLTVGDALDAWIDLENVGEHTWTGTTRLAPTPRDVASPLADPSWLSPTRITGPMSDTPSGSVGRFAFRFLATAPGDYYQTFGIVEEGVTWFSDKPLGGGPPDDQLEVHIVVVDGPPPLPPPPAEDSTGGEESSGDDSEAGTGVGEGGEAGDDTGAPTSGGSAGSGGSATSAGTATTQDPGATVGESDGDEGCGCNTRAPHGPWFALLALLGLPRARKRRVSAP